MLLKRDNILADKKPKLLNTCTHTHTLIKMGTKTITIMNDVYELLARNKRKDESFSEELRRIVPKKGNIMECAGLWADMSDKDAEDMKKTIDDFGKRFTKSLLKRTKKYEMP